MNIINYFATVNRDKLSDYDKEIVNLLADNIDEIEFLTINELAQITYTSTSTLFRIVKKLGFDSFSDFKYAIKNSLDDYNKYNPKKNNFFLSKVFDSLEKTDVLIDEYITNAAKAISDSNILYIYGTGWKQLRELDLFATDLNLYNIKFEHIRSKDEFDRINKYKRTIIMIVSLSGNIENLYDKLIRLKKKGVRIVGVSSESNNLLNDIADFKLQYSSSDIDDKILHWQTITLSYILDRLKYEIASLVNSGKDK
ncbi:MAG: hypothetical protein MR512_02425 [Anaerococcus sp.]|nr:hypothetical protein [Anaerococcus sp.]